MDQSAASGLTFLLEIGTEDLPARFIHPAVQQLEDNTRKILNENRMRFSGIKTYGTPRRLAVIVHGMPSMQDHRRKEIFGPSKGMAFDKNNSPTKAAVGFAQSQGVRVENLVVKNKGKGEYVVAVVDEKGVQIREILSEILKKIVLSIHLPKSMRWGNSSIRFVRPIRWLTALLEKEVIGFEIDGIKSSNLTRGHRFLSPAAFRIEEIPDYERLLANNYVVVDYEERKKIILTEMEALIPSDEEKPVRDEELLDTVANLVEYPVPVLAKLFEEYLGLPRELLITVMKDHQKYFAVEDKNGKITNHFVVISNTGEENSETVRIGAERVIKARFEDARFYFEEDRKHKLSERTEGLKKVTFQESLGSLYEKTKRIESITGFLADRLLPSAKDAVTRAAWLSKTDLITGAVREFPELQGIMGKYYALHDGEAREVAEALEEQYLPAHSRGRLPRTDTGAILSITDKIDNIAAFFSIGLSPTGSEDPFALRRQALGIIAILFDKGYSLPLRELVDKALGTLPDVKDLKEAEGKILQFFAGRLETLFADQGYGPDLIQSVLTLSFDDELKSVQKRLEAIKGFKADKGFADFLSAIKRVHNIIPKKTIPVLKEELLLEEPEKELKKKLDAVRCSLAGPLRAGKFHEAIGILISLAAAINNFFDRVLVMDKREEVKLNRLSLINQVWETASGIANFSKLSVSQEA
jgi:glycyl-tRNA synthetase beta chain